MIGELAALGAALSWAGGSLIVKPLTTRFGPLSLNALRNAAAWPFVAIFLLSTGKMAEVSLIHWHAVAYIIGSGVIGLVIGTTLYLRALSAIDLAKVYPVSYSCWLLSTVFIAAAFLGELVTWSTIIGAFVIIFGITLLVVPSSSKRKQVEASFGTGEARGIILALLTGLCWAVATTFLKLGLMSTNAALANFIRLPPTVLLLVAPALRERRSKPFAKYDLKALGWVSVAGFLDQAVGGVLFFVSIQLTGAAKATIVSSTSPLFVTALAVLLLKEKVTVRIFLGTLCCVLGIWLTV